MEISDLLLKKEEVPILHEVCFTVPIHPLLLELELDPNLALKIFPQVTEEWYEELQNHVEVTEMGEQKRAWYNSVFLRERPQLKTEFGRWIFPDRVWESTVQINDNGFASCLSISRNSGGTIYYNPSMGSGHQEFVPIEEANRRGFILLSPEKSREFGFRGVDFGNLRGVLVHTYASHNIDSYPGALFLRNWGITYINEAMKSVM